MRNLIFSLSLLPLLGGCIIYDHNGKGCQGEFGSDCFDSGFTDSGPIQVDDTGRDTGGTTDTDTDVAESFRLDPSEVEAGTTVITSLTATGFDLTQVVNVQFYGTVTLIAAENRADEILMTINVPAGASPGAVDMLLELADGTAKMVEGALTITATQDTGGDTGTPCE